MKTKQPTPLRPFAPFGKKIEHAIGFQTCPMKNEFADAHDNHIAIGPQERVPDCVSIQPARTCSHCKSPMLVGPLPLPRNTIYRRDEMLLSGLRLN